MPYLSLANAALQAEVNGVTALLNSGYMDIFSGTIPANGNTALSGNTLLASFVLNATAFGAANTTGLATANSIASVAAGNNGTATFARFYKSDHATFVMDADVGTSTQSVIIGSTTITSGETVSVSSLTYQGN